MDELSPVVMEEPDFHRRKKFAWLVFGILLIGLLVGLGYYMLVYRYYQSTDNAYVKADLTWIVPRVSGAVTELQVKDNQEVRQGQLLAVLDNRDLQARYEQSQAMVAAREASFAVQNQNEKAAEAGIFQAHSSVNVAQASITQAQSSVETSKAELHRLQAEHVRYQQLLNDGVITQQKFEAIRAQYLSAQANYQNTLAAVESAKGQYQHAMAAVYASQAQTESVKATRIQMQADLNSAKASAKFNQIDVNSSQVVTPVSGKIGNIAVRLGSRVSPQTRLMAIIPDHSVYVEANFKETQIEKMQIGQRVELTLDAYPSLTFQGKIESFAPASGATFSMMPPDNATGNFNKVVQRIPVRIAIQPHPQLKLVKPGLSVVAQVDLRS
ncbi:HlyD family secretion protein [Acinetobacter dispersus]|uniref:HlyD family secretion protein n=1 Tax=Acinetobacter dispersus TaxID=70348 RepID=UPI001F4B646F|nr:HlyD family secretion protein [Acinetobacter dispersus]MCH7389031.1 HlyD family secretion protein [Acinetobacter dispersus]